MLTGVLFAMTLLSLVGAAITQSAGFVALLLVRRVAAGGCLDRVPGCRAPWRKENVENTARTIPRPGGVFESDKQQCAGSNRLRDPAAHLGGADEGTLPGEEVGGAVALVQHGLHGVLHGVGLLQQAEGVPEHHGGREDGGHGVGLVLAGNVRGGAVDGLVHAEVALCQGGGGACRWSR